MTAQLLAGQGADLSQPLATAGIPEPSLVASLDVVTPNDARQLLRDLEAAGQLLVKLLPPRPAAARPPSLLLARRGSAGGPAAASSESGSGSGAGAVRHFWPALSTSYGCWETVVPTGCRDGSTAA